MIELKLPIKTVQDGEESIITKTFVIDELSFFQFAKLLKVLDKAFTELKKDNEMNEFIESVFGAQIEADTPKEVMEQLDKDFMSKAMGAFNFLAVKLPDRLMEILAVLSGIEQRIIENQKMAKVMDVYDAIIEANDIEALVNRLKKSFGATVAAMKFLNLKQKVTQQ